MKISTALYLWGKLMRVKLGEVCERGSSNLMQKDVTGCAGDYPIYGASGQIGFVDFYHQERPYVAVVKDGAGIGRTMLLPAKSSVIGTMQYLLPKENVLPDYLCYVVQYMHLEKYFSGATIPHIYFRDYKDEEFDLSSLDEQAGIVKTLNGVVDVIEKRRQQLSNLDVLIKARFVELFGEPEANTKNWPVVNMADLCIVGSSKRIYQSEQSMDGVPFWRISDLTNLINTGMATTELFISEERYMMLQAQEQVPVEGDILVTSRGTLGQCYIVRADDKFYFQDGMISWLSEYADGITPLYIAYLFSMPGFRKQIDSMQAGSTVAYLSIAMIRKLKVMLPDMETQNQFSTFVAQVDKSKAVVQAAHVIARNLHSRRQRNVEF